MARVAENLRRQVYERAQGICEYCQTQQLIVINMHIDHIVPLSAGGKSELDNLCLSCISCNGAKHRFQTGIDPASQLEAPLFNPRAQSWTEHFAWNGGWHARHRLDRNRSCNRVPPAHESQQDCAIPAAAGLMPEYIRPKHK